MKRFLLACVLSTFVPFLTVGLWTPDEAEATLLRLAAHTRRWQNEDFTGFRAPLPPPAASIPNQCFTAAGVLVACLPIYTTTVFAPATGVLYVTISATGDGHGGAGSRFSCVINGGYCSPPGLPPADGSPNGWVTLLKLSNAPGATNCNQGGGGTGDCHDNNITYTWCKRVNAGTHTVRLNMASSLPPNFVFVEKAFFYVDFTSPFYGSPATCSQGSPPGLIPGASGVAPQ
jgi:hypothetical protein